MAFTTSSSMDSEREQQFLSAYKENADALFRFCYLKVSNRELAKDILQEVLMKAWDYIQKGNDVGNMKSFLFKVARNAVIDEYRKKKPQSLDALRDQGFDVGIDDHEAIIRSLDGERAMALLATIPESYRDAIYMQYVEGLSLREIAEVTGETENNISVRIHRGMQKLRDIFRQVESP